MSKAAVSPFRDFNSSPEIIHQVMMYVRFPLSLRNVEDLLSERGIGICYWTVRLWWNRFSLMFAGRPQLPVGCLFGLSTQAGRSSTLFNASRASSA